MLEAEAAGEDPGKFPGAAWDPETRAWRAPAELHHELVVRHPDEAGRFSDEIRTPMLAGSWELPALRWYQQEALARWGAADRRGVVALPTGSGKTLVALAAIAQLGVATLCLVPTRVLLDQWARALEACWSFPIGRLGDGDHRVAPITVATYASAVGWAPRIGDRFGLVIVDEAHHVGAWCPSEVLEMLVAPARLGLTATPPPPGGALADRIGPVVYTLGVDDLAGDALAHYEIIPVKVALDPGERLRYTRQRSEFASVYSKTARAHPRLGWREFVKQASRTTDGRRALESWRGYRALIAYPDGKRAALRELLARHAGQRTLVFTGDNATAYTIARELLVMPITHEIGRAERAQVLERFRNGEISVLVSSQVLDEGLDVPDADVAIVVGGSSSFRRHVQRIGRVLRPREGKRAIIYELEVAETKETDYVRRRHGEDPELASVGGAW